MMLRHKPHLPIIVFVLLVLLALATTWVAYSAILTRAAPSASDWSTYNYNLAASGNNTAETTLGPTTFPNLKVQWTAHGASGISAQPIVVGNVVYWGSWDGNLHATNITGTNAGKNLWTVNLGLTTGGKGCNPKSLGIASTAAYGTIGTTPTLYIGGGGNNTAGGGHVYLYAINATNGAVIWKTSIGTSPSDFAWSSPVIYNGSVYYGVASLADCPLTRGRILKLDATTGTQQAIFNTVPAGCVAGGIWGSPSIDTATGMLYVATGNLPPSCKTTTGDYGMSLLELRASDLSYVSHWEVPRSQALPDGDFGSAPTLFSATIGGTTRAMVGIANKDGIFFAFDRTNIAAGPIWERAVAVNRDGPQSGGGSLSPAVWNGSTLFVAGGNTTIRGTSCRGGVRALNPATGTSIWEFCMTSGPILASLAGVPGVVVAVGGPNVVALNSTTGQTIFTYHDTSGKPYWAPVSIANGHMFAANMDSSLVAFGL